MGQSSMPILHSSARRSATGPASRKQHSGAGLASVLRLSALAASFDGTTFGDYATFNGAAFGYLASFNSALFKGGVTFIAGPGPNPNEKKDDPENSLKQRHRRLWKHRGSGPDRFQSISFANARFNSDIEMARPISQVGLSRMWPIFQCAFFHPPDFDNVTNVVQDQFQRCPHWFRSSGQTPVDVDSEIPVRLRALRKIAEETKNHDLERDLYIEERKAERGVYGVNFFEELKKAPKMEKPLIFGRLLRHGLWIVVMFGYWALADYGRSFLGPSRGSL